MVFSFTSNGAAIARIEPGATRTRQKYGRISDGATDSFILKKKPLSFLAKRGEGEGLEPEEVIKPVQVSIVE